LIVVLEEFDIIISKIHFGTITQHKSLPSNIYDKTSWNQFFDRFDRRYYPWVILVLTSNVKPEVIDSLDPSYIRNGRINKVFELKNTKDDWNNYSRYFLIIYKNILVLFS
jgi:hypothetical protein